MPRRRHRQASAPPVTSTGWQWRTFPVFFAFIFGVFVTGLAAGFGGAALSILFLGSLAGMGFGLAHIVTRQIAVRRARNSAQRADVAPPGEPLAPRPSAPGPARRRRRR